MKQISNRNIVDKETLSRYDDIDGLKVIEEYLLFKGTDDVKRGGCILLKSLEKMALITYGLKVNATNSLYVGWHLDKFFKRAGLFRNSMLDVSIPNDIYDRVAVLHKEFKDRPNS